MANKKRKRVSKNVDKWRIIPYPSEHVVVDEKGKRVVSCPTEREAEEYIKMRKAEG